jgi:hypothetical protein
MSNVHLPGGSPLERERAVDETTDEPFDRAAFARWALDLLAPPETTVAICEGARRLRVESGRLWGRPSPAARWALLALPPNASRRAIALAVAELTRLPRAYALDLLFGAPPAARGDAA